MNPASQHQNVFISFVRDGQKHRSLGLSHAQGLKSKIPGKHYCDKCRFSSRDHIQFQKHVSQHAEMTFSCSYCSHVSYTKGESQRHLVLHTGRFPYKCQFCEYGAIRNDYIVKHTERVHRYVPERSSGAKKHAFALKNSRSLSSKWHASTASSRKSVTAARRSPSAGTDANSSKKVAMEKTSGGSGLAKLQVELLAPLNEPIQHDRPLTVTYPSELSIPPGCFVELVEVKTVNGTKELELKLVSQHPAEEGSLEKGLLADRNEVAVGQNEKADVGDVSKPSFRCSVIPQEEKVIISSPLEQKQHMQQQRGFSVIKDLLARPPLTNQKKHPNKTLTPFKEEPEEQEIEPGGKTESVIRSCKNQMPVQNEKRHEHDSRSVNIIKLNDPVSSLPTKIISVSQQMCNPKSSPQGSASKVVAAHTCQKPTNMHDKQAQTVSNLCSSEKLVHMTREESPPVSKPFVRPNDEVGTTDNLGPKELPVISSVFSLHSGHDDINACVGWQHAKNLELNSERTSCPEETQVVARGCDVGSPALQDLKTNNNCLHVPITSTMTDSRENVEGTKCDVQTHADKKISLNVSSLQEKGPPSSLLYQNTAVFDQNKTNPCNTESDRSLPDAVHGPKFQGNTEATTQPVFIPEGATLRISGVNRQSQKTAATSTDNCVMSGTWMPRAVLSCGASEQNIANAGPPSQCTGLKLSLKRRRSGAENEGLAGHWVQLDSQPREDPSPGLKPCKQKKKRKKHKKASKIKVLFQKSAVSQGEVCRRWLIPLKEDQPVTFPSPNQPVVILNHPRPQTLGEASGLHAVKIPKQIWSTSSTNQVLCDPVQTHCLLKMKLKKVNQNKYQVVGFIYRDLPARTLKY